MTNKMGSQIRVFLGFEASTSFVRNSQYRYVGRPDRADEGSHVLLG
jgi:hypothetical protein